MTKIVLQDIASLTNETAALAAINSNNATIGTGSDNFLSRDGTSPNQMLADLDMNSNNIINLPAPAGPTEPLRLQDLSTFIGGGTIVITPSREKLTGNRTYFVRTDGSDSHSGLVNNAAGAFLTIQKAVDTLKSIDGGGNAVTIQVGSGTYTGGTSIGPTVGIGFFTIVGDNTTPTNVVISTTSASCFSLSEAGSVNIQGFKLQTTTSGDCITAGVNSIATMGNMNYGSSAGFHQACVASTSLIINSSNYTISGGATGHWHCSSLGSNITAVSITVTLTGTPNFSSFFAGVAQGNCTAVSVTFSGAATGPRFLVHKNGVFDSQGTGGLTYLPGNTAGTVASGGVYWGSTIVEGTSGNISFPAAQVASSDVNTLDDYEEGTWTPNDASGAALTFTAVDGKYTKIGNLVTATGTFVYPVTANGNSAKIGGLPFAFTTGSGRAGNIMYHNGATAGNILGDASATTASYFTTSGGAVTNTQMSATTNWVQFVYHT